jgi:hypothetical protein
MALTTKICYDSKALANIVQMESVSGLGIFPNESDVLAYCPFNSSCSEDCHALTNIGNKLALGALISGKRELLVHG